MATSNPRLLFDKLNLVTKKTLEAAAALTLSRTHYDVEIEHLLVKFLDQPNSDVPVLLKHYSLDAAGIRKELDAALNRFKTGNGRAPSLSTNILDLIREAWLIGSIECGAPQVRSGHMLAALLTDPKLKQWISGSTMSLVRLPGDTLQRELKDLLPKLPSDETVIEQNAAATAPGGGGAAPAGGGNTAGMASKTQNLDQFTMNLTASAKAGKIDAVVGRDAEIRQVIDILTRRRQNNPILTGEAGVGKTAVVEGLAIRIASGDVPPPLKNVTLRTLDLGLLTAGAGVKGEFENRLKGVIDEVKSSPSPIILFIDEAHTMIGAGGQSGGNDAANLLKPALARGELRTIAATTFSEYKQHFETDAALKRRFQQVKVDEPNEEKTVRMLRGLLSMLEKHHKVRILAEAVTETVKLSTRYMPDRQQPDKSVSLLDTTCARVALSQSATPPALEDVKREVEHLTTEIAFLEREGQVSAGNPERLAESKERKTIAEGNVLKLEEQLKKEQEVVAKIKAAREAIEAAVGAEKPPATLDADRAALAALNAELTAIQGETPLIYPVVDGKAVAEVLSGLTGIPLGKMVRNELQTVLALADRLGERVVGQGHGLEAIAQRIRTSRAELGDPSKPIAVILLVGPSGVGKTETALALADLLYGGERNMVTINMSEFKNESDVSKLKGTTAGFVGYGQGGVLTNAVRNRPYSVVLLDEFEKAHPGVYELFFQVFDKGTLSDDRSEVNFKNCIILLTANVGTDTLMKHCADPDTMPSADALADILRPELEERFSPALLGRIKVVPFFPLQEDVLKQIIKLKLKKIGTRLKENYKASFEYTPGVVDAVAARCTEVSSGARNVDHILTGTLQPQLAQELLARMAEGRPVKAVKIGVDAESQFTYDVA